MGIGDGGYTGSQAPVQYTSDLATLSKFSASKAGYFVDRIIPHMVMRNGDSDDHDNGRGGKRGRRKHPRRSPLIHFGYWLRFVAIEEMVRAFLDGVKTSGYNVVQLGSGYSSDAYNHSWPDGLEKYVECDFPAVVNNKFALLKEAGITIPDWLEGVGCDLRDLKDLGEKLRMSLDLSLPTLVIMEVVLPYLEPEYSGGIPPWLSSLFPNVFVAIYEQQYAIGSSFATFMMQHFTQRQAPLLSLHSVPDIAAQRLRYSSFEKTWAVSMSSLIQKSSRNGELDRVRELEPFDEFEELYLTLAHYLILVAASGRPAKEFSGVAGLHPRERESVREKTIEVETSLSHNTENMRFGLSATSLDNHHVVICGGFGYTAGSDRQERQCAISVQSENTTGATKSKVVGMHGASMYCTATSCTNRVVVVFGGRLGPKSPSDCLSIVRPLPSSGSDFAVERVNKNSSKAWPSARWRHSGNSMIIGGNEVVVVIGGREDLKTVSHLRGVWILKLETKEWSYLDVEPDGCTSTYPQPRHSHGSVVLQSENGVCVLLVCGGLNSACEPLQDTWKLKIQVLPSGRLLHAQWYCVESSLLSRGRFGHSCHLLFDHSVLIVGGVEDSCFTPQMRLAGRDIALKIPSDLIFMSHNHASFLQGNSLVITGGGGNCFSFGTHFNAVTLKVDLEALRHIEPVEKALS